MKTLFDRVKINSIEIKNRFVRSATWENMGDECGHFTDRLFKVYEDLAKGGAGLIITSVAYITDDSKSLNGQIGFYNDDFIEEYKVLTSMVHNYGSKIVLQVNCASKAGKMLNPNEITIEDMQSIISAYGDVADRARRANFDGIQIHAAHGFFLSSFLSPSKNKRTDKYGGSPENNSKFIVEIFDEIRRKTSGEFNVLIKINCIDSIDLEKTFEFCKYTCIELSKRGINGIEISGDSDIFSKKDISSYNESVFREYAAKIAAEINSPVILVGRNRSSVVMEDILNNTGVELFSLSRPLIRQPFLVNIWEEDILQASKCISCNKCYQESGNTCIFA